MGINALQILMAVWIAVHCYVQLPLTTRHGEFGLQLYIPVKVEGQTSEFLLSWDYENETLQLPQPIVELLNKRHQSLANVQFSFESVEAWSLQGAKRIFIQAVTFQDGPVMQAVNVSMPYRPSNITTVNGFINLSRSPLHNIVLRSLLDKYESGSQTFSLYMSRSGSFLQLGGLDTYYTDGPITRIQCLKKHHWVFDAQSISIGQHGSDKQAVLKRPFSVRLDLKQRHITLPQRFLQPLKTKMMEQRISCQTNSKQRLSCSSMTSLQLRLTEISVETWQNFSFAFPLSSLHQSTNHLTQQITFAVQFIQDDYVTLGSNVLQQYYVSFDIERGELAVALSNRNPTESQYVLWLVRLAFYSLAISMGIGLLCGIPTCFNSIRELFRSSSIKDFVEEDVLPTTTEPE